MALGSGLASQIGVKKETTWGTRVAPTSFYEYESEGIKHNRNRIVSRGLRAGRTFQNSGRRVTVTRDASGPVSLEVPNKGFGVLLDLLHGNTVTPTQQAATTAYSQVHNIGASDPSKSATIQVGRPGTDGTVRPFDYVGAQVTDYTFSCDTGGFLMASFTFDCKDEDTSQTLASASYPTGLESFDFSQASTVTVNGTDVSDRVTSFNLSGSAARKTDRYFLGAGGTKAKPIQNDYSAATVTFDGEFKDLTTYDLFTGDDIVPVVVTFTSGTEIDTGYPYEISFSLAACQADGETPNVSGPDVLGQQLALTVLDDGTNPPVAITYQSSDVTV